MKSHLFKIEMSIAGLTLTEVRLIFFMYVEKLDRCICMIKIFQTQRRYFVALSKVSNTKNFYDRGEQCETHYIDDCHDFENMVKLNTYSMQ